MPSMKIQRSTSFAMSFGNQGRNLSSPLSTLRVMLKSGLLYLRVGCRNIDSSFMASLPTQILTLDAAFTDPDPRHLATNLRIMRERCEKLFNLAIAVSPLHDCDTLSSAGDICFNRFSLSRDVLQLWEPFWNSLEHLKSTGVRVWEGKGPGFKRPRDTAVSLFNHVCNHLFRSNLLDPFHLLLGTLSYHSPDSITT